MKSSKISIVVLIAGAITLASCTVPRAYTGASKNPSEVALLEGSMGFSPFISSIGVVKVNDFFVRAEVDRYDQAPSSVEVMAAESSVKVELRRENVYKWSSPSAFYPKICIVNLEKCNFVAGHQYQIDYFRLSQETVEDRWKGNIGVVINDTKNDEKVCEGSQLCRGF